MPFDRLAAYIGEPTATGRCTFMRVNGIGTSDEPLRLASIVRHPDMADESTLDEALLQTRQVVDALESALSAIKMDELISSTLDTSEELKQVLQVGDSTALHTGSYYSAGAAILAGTRLIIAGIGRIKVWLWSEQTLQVLIEPTVMLIPESPDASSILTSTIGIGFTRDKVQFAEAQLESDQLVVLEMGIDLLQVPESSGQEGKITSARSLLDRIERELQIKPPLIAVIGPMES
ncbi:MAG TPA: hypothetical protein VF131_17930 [Blastocatellia bacterium]|nr:hypothetical protein [Blastocatellia bacterium]